MTKKQDKSAVAQQIVDEAKKLGCSIRPDGEWVVFSPPLPVDLMMRSMDVSSEIAEIVRRGDSE